MSYISECKKCELCLTRTTPTTWVGTPGSKLCIVGMNPGINEDRVGLPFVGESGRLLTSLMLHAGLIRESVTMTNAVCCYGSTITAEHISACNENLKLHLKQANPKILVLLGRVAMTAAGVDVPIHAIEPKLYYTNLGYNAILARHPSSILKATGTLKDRYIESFIKQLKFAYRCVYSNTT